MKLYTEEAIKEAMEKILSTYGLYGKKDTITFDLIIDEITPIELPSDDEIEIRSAQKAMIENPLIQGICKYYFNLGAVYVRDKIVGGNK